MDDFIFQWICLLLDSMFFIFYLFCLFFKWYADFKTENLKREIKQKNPL